MFDWLNATAQAKALQYVYRYRFLATYVVIGFLSILVELIIYRATKALIGPGKAQVLGLALGILLAFYLNVRFNFKVPAPKRNRAFVLFAMISLFSFGLSVGLRQVLTDTGLSFEADRLLASGVLFFLAYLLHRRFSFREFKQVGVAIYATGTEDIKGIHARIRSVADFIHVDIIDKTFLSQAPDPTTYRLEAIRAYWPSKLIHCHIMSRTPSMWLDQVIPHVDTVVIQLEVGEDVDEVIARIKAAGRKVGLCLLMETPVEAVTSRMDAVDEVMLLTIPKPGRSGQEFCMEALEKILAFNRLPGRERCALCVDGGINHNTIRLVQAEKVVSGSYVLNGDNPERNIMRLQTSSQYEAF